MSLGTLGAQLKSERPSHQSCEDLDRCLAAELCGWYWNRNIDFTPKGRTLLRTHHGFITHTYTILWVAHNGYDKLKLFGISAYIDEFSCKNYVSPPVDRQPTAQKWLKNNFCPVLASLLLQSSVPSHETCKNLEATQISFHSSTRTIHRLLTPAALKQPYPHPHSTQKSPLPVKTTYSIEETPSQCRDFHTDDRSRRIVVPTVHIYDPCHFHNP